MKKMNMKMKRVICMVSVLVMVFSLTLSACATGDSSSRQGTYSGFYPGTGSIFDWMNRYPGSQNQEETFPENPSENSGEAPSDSTAQTCPAPVNITVKSRIGTCSRVMEFAWDKVEGADKYITQLSVSDSFSGDDVEEHTLSSAKIIYTINSGSGIYYYPAHRTYYFRVKAVSGSSESEWSETVISLGDSKS